LTEDGEKGSRKKRETESVIVKRQEIENEEIQEVKITEKDGRETV
jgi:hypothetical protein